MIYQQQDLLGLRRGERRLGPGTPVVMPQLRRHSRDLEADHRRHAEIENAIRDLKYGVGLNHLPSGRFPANAAWLAV